MVMARLKWWSSHTGGRVALFAVVAATALPVAACGSSSKSSSSAAGPTTAAKSAAPGSSSSANALKIGVLATCGGAFALFESEAFSGAKYALINEAGGKSLGSGAYPRDRRIGNS